MFHISRFLATPLILLSTLTAGCGKSTPRAETPLRAVKVETVRNSEGDGLPVIGRVRTAQRADLSFEVSGRIAAIAVDVGDVIRRGQTLARLDVEPARLKLQQAQTDVSAAKARMTERDVNYRQQQALFNDRMISPAILAAAHAAYQGAVEQFEGAQATAALAARAVRNSVIVAPFDGLVVSRSVQPFSDVAAGQLALQIEGKERLEVVGMLPAALARDIKPGTVVSAYSTDNPAQAVPIQMANISGRIENGALVQAIFRATEPNAALRSGETAIISLPLTGARTPSVSVTALLPTTPGKQASVFVYNAHTGKVTSRSVVPDTMNGGRVILREGVAVGETVVVAGAPFLVDGQAVSLYQPATKIGREQVQ